MLHKEQLTLDSGLAGPRYAEPDYLSLIIGAHVVDRENQLPQVL